MTDEYILKLNFDEIMRVKHLLVEDIKTGITWDYTKKSESVLGKVCCALYGDKANK